MEFSLRDARPSDKERLSPWTTHTFAWGDYVVDSFDDWMTHPQSRVLVAADDTDEPIAVARGVLLSADELWLHGVRVHPEWRRRGIASQLGDNLQQWGAEQGAKVALLMTEDWNEAARDQVTAIGFRRTATWLRAFQPIREGQGRAASTRSRTSEWGSLNRAASAEVVPAWMAWTGGALIRAARGMMAVAWQWRRLHLEDLERAAEFGALFAGPTGWAIGAPRDRCLEIGWMQTTPDWARAHLDALVSAATAEEASALEIMMPAVPWLEETAAAARFELERLELFEKPL